MASPAPLTAHPAMITGRRPSLSAARPAGSRIAPFIAANTPSPIPVHTGEECST